MGNFIFGVLVGIFIANFNGKIGNMFKGFGKKL